MVLAEVEDDGQFAGASLKSTSKSPLRIRIELLVNLNIQKILLNN